MSNPIVDQLIAKTMQELSDAEKPRFSSRSWSSSQGYKFLIPWSNAVLLRILIRKVTDGLPRSEYRMKAQIDDASRSVVANIEEGFKRATTGEYIRFISFSQGSLEEVKGDIERLLQDKFIYSRTQNILLDLGINLKSWNEWARNPQNFPKLLYFPLKPFKGIYRNLKEIKGNELSYEVLIELINKTDYLLRKLVKSLEIKIQNDKLKLLR